MNKLFSEFNIGKSAITDIKKNELTLMSYSGKLESLKGVTSRKTMQTAENDNLDCAVYTLSLIHICVTQNTINAYCKDGCNTPYSIEAIERYD